MNHMDLYQIKDFQEIFVDPRFAGILMYLETNRPKATSKEPHGMIQDSGKLEAHLAIIDTLRALQRPPTLGAKMERGVPYNTNLPEQK